jgi:hypothetical protein
MEERPEMRRKGQLGEEKGNVEVDESMEDLIAPLT